MYSFFRKKVYNRFSNFYLAVSLTTFSLILNCDRNSLYLDYLFGLNYWSANTLYIFIILGFMAKIRNILYLTFFFFLLFKFNLTEQTFFQKKLVETLFVGTITVHPLLFYLSLILVLLLTLGRYTPYLGGTLSLTSNTIVRILIITLVLGGFWGFQSTVWGYFWVNDTIEWLLLLVLCYYLFKVHVLVHVRAVVNPCFLLVFLLNLILVVRLNLLPTRHSFIQNTNVFIYVMSAYYSLLFLCWGSKLCAVSVQNAIPPTTASLAVASNLFFGKIFFLINLVFLLVKLTPKFFTKSLYSHLALIAFFLVWNVYFFFFELYYHKSQTLLQGLGVFTEELWLHTKQLVTRTAHFKDLEGVSFVLQDYAVRSFRISNNLIVSVVLNNIYLLYLFFVYLLL